MASVTEIMQGLERRLETIPELNVYDIEAGQVTAPAAVIGLPTDVDYLRNFEPSYDLVFTVRVLVSQNIDFESQHALAAYMDKEGTHSIRYALALDERLENLVSFAILESAVPQEITYNGITYYGAVFTIRVSN